MAGIFWLGLLVPATAGAQDERVIRFDIPRQRADQALVEFAEQADVTFIFPVDETRKVTANAVQGKFTQEAAIQKLLEGTGLHPKFQANGELVVKADNSVEPGDAVKKRGLIATIIAALAGGASVAANAADTAGSSDRQTLEEIIVTAQKRVERLQDVPVPVTAIDAAVLADSNQLRIQDYYTLVPGLNFTMGNRGEPFLSIRGLTTDIYTNPTIGVVVDDVPYGSSTVLGGGFAVPDIDPSELRQVEVLRGPQGTLYGASSLGGLLKFVTVDPSTEATSGRMQGGVSSIENGDETGYSVRGFLNVALSDTFAMRVSGFTRHDPGYIDNVQTGVEGVNRGSADGGRLSALWRPSETLSLRLSAMLQNIDRDGASEVHVLPGLGDLQQSALDGSGIYNKKVQAYSANLSAKLGSADLVSLSGYSINKAFTTIDYTPLLGAFFTQPLFGVTGSMLLENNETKRFSQEVRLSAPLGDAVNGLFGVFYTDEKSSVVAPAVAVDPEGQTVGTLLDSAYPTTYREYAAFTNVTFQLTEAFDIQVGAREGWNKQTYSQLDEGPLVPAFFGFPTPLVTPQIETKENAFTYLVTPRLRVSPDLMVYSRFASGYRPGGPNTGCSRFAVPCEYDADTTLNYEIGVKGDTWDNKLSFDASVYYVDWKDIQLLVNEPAGSFNTNAGRAKSQGVELSMEWRPLAGLSVATWAAWNDAVLTEDMPASASVVGRSGDRLPVSSRFTGNFSVNQHFSLPNSFDLFVSGSVSYVGDRMGGFRGTFQGAPLPRQRFAPYAKTDLLVGIRHESWTANAFANNLTNRRGVLSGGLGHLLPYGFTYIQPRTVGVSVSKSF